MANRGRISSFRAKRHKGSKLSMEDRISALPNKLLVYILSLLTMKEAGQTCVLSKRWRYVWAYIPILNFDASDTIDNLLLDKVLFHVEKPRYLRWVKQVVQSYRGPTIDEFRVRFDLTVTSRHSIDNWVKFVMEKRVKRLELNFPPDMRDLSGRCYTFRCSLISNLLTSLKLVFVNVTGEILQNFLRTCPNLECLWVENSKSLVNLEVLTDEALNLKHLELCYCHNVHHIEVSAPNLVSFSYIGPQVDVPIKNTPKLSKLSVGGSYGIYMINNSLEWSNYLFQLEALRMALPCDIDKVLKSVDQFPLCPRLKQLELIVDPRHDEHLFCFGKILKACPLLHKFVLTINWFSSPPTESEWLEVKSCPHHNLNMLEVGNCPHYHLEIFQLDVCPYFGMKMLGVETCPHYHLKIVEILAFVGDPIEFEFILYLMETCIALEKIVIDPGKPSLIGSPWEFEVDERKTRARIKAEQLRNKLKPDIDLIVL